MTRFRELKFYTDESAISDALYKDFLLNEGNVCVFSDTETALNLEFPISPLDELDDNIALAEKSIYILTNNGMIKTININNWQNVFPHP